MFTFNLDSEVINIYNAPILNETKDGSGESGEFVLEFRTLKEPIKPHTEFSVYQDGNLIVNAIVESDEVEIVSKSPITYKHTIDYIAKAQALKNYFVRDSVITQPPIKQVSCYFSTFTNIPDEYYSIGGIYFIANTTSESFTLPKKAKIKNVYINVNIYSIGGTSVGTSKTGLSIFQLGISEVSIPKVSFYIDKSGASFILASGLTIKNGDKIEIDSETIETIFNNGGTFSISQILINNNVYNTDILRNIISCELVVEYYYYNLYNVVEELKEQTELKEYV